MELFDLYNADRKPIERTMIRGQSQPENTFRLVVHCCVLIPTGICLFSVVRILKKAGAECGI